MSDRRAVFWDDAKNRIFSRSRLHTTRLPIKGDATGSISTRGVDFRLNSM